MWETVVRLDAADELPAMRKSARCRREILQFCVYLRMAIAVEKEDRRKVGRRHHI